MTIQCNECGARQRFKYSAGNVNNLIAFGWNSSGVNLFCPECAKLWYQKHSTYLDGELHTIKMIDMLAEKCGYED